MADEEFDGYFATEMKAPLGNDGQKLRLHIFVDTSSIEVFARDGQTVMSAVTYPSPAQTGITLFSEGGQVQVALLEAWKLNN